MICKNKIIITYIYEKNCYKLKKTGMARLIFCIIGLRVNGYCSGGDDGFGDDILYLLLPDWREVCVTDYFRSRYFDNICRRIQRCLPYGWQTLIKNNTPAAMHGCYFFDFAFLTTAAIRSRSSTLTCSRRCAGTFRTFSAVPVLPRRLEECCEWLRGHASGDLTSRLTWHPCVSSGRLNSPLSSLPRFCHLTEMSRQMSPYESSRI